MSKIPVKLSAPVSISLDFVFYDLKLSLEGTKGILKLFWSFLLVPSRSWSKSEIILLCMSQRTTISFKARKLFNCRNIENWNNIRCWPWLRHTSVLIKYLSIQFSIYRVKCLEIKDLFHFLLSSQSYWYLEMLVQVHKNRQCFIFFSQKYPQKVWTLHNGNLHGQIWSLLILKLEVRAQ